tara:strand:+ start:5148 stop:6947 length:1800 start_codon:yes stop_codon:yes gene_type:complete
MANFAELRLFGQALRKTNASDTVNSVLVRTCASKGYVMRIGCDPERVMSYMQSLPNNYNSTFYKSFNDVINRSEEAWWVDQCMHYASTYGTGHTDTPYVPNNNPSLINFSECKVIDPITMEELHDKIQNMADSGIALKNDTLNDIFELIEEFDMSFWTDNIKNREFLIRYHIAKGIPFKNVIESLQAINFIITGSTCIVKSHDAMNAYSCSSSWDRFSNIKACFYSHSLEEWASIFNRYKPLFLALRNSELRPMINKISKLSKKHHVPTVMPMSTKFLTPEYVNNDKLTFQSRLWLRKYEDRSLFELVKYYNAIQKRRTGKFIDTINIRNGKSWVKKSSWELNEDNLDKLNSQVRRSISHKMREKLQGKTLNLPSGLGITLPTSEKNFIGTLPIGSYIDVMPQDNLIVGIYWKGEDGASDLDLSFTDIDGKTISWCNSYTDAGNNIVYSGDMTSADPEASEYLLFRNDMPNGIFMCNNYSGASEAKYTFIVARLPEGESFNTNHMVHPDDIIFQTPMVMRSNQMSMAIHIGSRFIFTDRAIGNGRVARAGVTTRDLIQSQIEMADMSLTLNEFIDHTELDGEVVDLTTDDKSALISLLS